MRPNKASKPLKECRPTAALTIVNPAVVVIATAVIGDPAELTAEKEVGDAGRGQMRGERVPRELGIARERLRSDIDNVCDAPLPQRIDELPDGATTIPDAHEERFFGHLPPPPGKISRLQARSCLGERKATMSS